MRPVLTVLIPLCLASAACPAWEEVALRGGNQTGETLQGGRDYAVIAGGDQALRACGFAHTGHVMTRPDFEFHVTALARYGQLRLRVRGGCDTVLLVNASDGRWYFDDNSAGADPVITFFHGLEGTYDIWVGTYGPQTCAATLSVESL